MKPTTNKKKSVRRQASRFISPHLVTRFTMDGLSLEGSPTLRATPAQPLYKYDLLVEQWKRYSMNVGVSPISDFISFNINQIPGIQNFLNIYDFYRVRKVVCLFKVLGTQVYWGNSSGDVPRISVAIDYNDGTTTAAPAQSYQNCLTTTMTNNFVRSFSPRTAISLYNGALSTAYIEGKPNQWIDTNYPAVPHYGLVINIGATSIDNQFVIGMDVLFVLEFKDPRFYSSSNLVQTNSSPEERRQAHLIGRLSSTTTSSSSSRPPISPKPTPMGSHESRGASSSTEPHHHVVTLQFDDQKG